MIIIIQLQLIM